ncbi:hypothetical protein IQ230_01785 [Gloeocapsopsis crepidinum LEGE 06123]|uniref:Uncharacterized protein n=1 Tax=Gloeocapsopsis crepidinum LEGE 06123 TaxID=588587 RepID=A0ABR9ULF4_9CHRO|nr:hypothetical protein [Gloeocapsopsis crepidinum]MBE9189116.1 hypothetical protein [Gloeocapsopsis crepidinum LEGE 06123]
MAKRNLLAWLAGSVAGVALFTFLFLYLCGAFRQEPEYNLTASPTVEDPHTRAALIQARQRGVDVRVITISRIFFSNSAVDCLSLVANEFAITRSVRSDRIDV